MIYVLLFGLILELVYCYYVFKKDLFSPSAILCEVFILSTIACIYNADTWGVDLGINTICVILGGNAVFIAISTIVHSFFERRYKKSEEKQRREKLDYVNIKPIILFLVLVAYIAFSIIYAKTVISLMGGLGQSGGISQLMASYRSETMAGDTLLPAWLARLNVAFGIGLYVLIYIFINNVIVDGRRKSNYMLLVAIMAYLVSSIFTAQRTTMLLAFIFTMFVTYMLLNRKYRFVQKLNRKYILRGAVALVAFLAMFGAVRGLFGRTGEVSPIDNVTYYMGNSIESLDLYIKEPLESQQFGEETFRQFRIYLSKHGLSEQPISQNGNLEFRRDANGNRAGNVYTGYRYYLHDFGYGSVLLFQAFLALFYGIWYEKLRRRKLKKNIDLSFILFAWFMLELFRFSITNAFFNSLAAFLFTYWYVFLIWKIILNLKISFKSSKRIQS